MQETENKTNSKLSEKRLFNVGELFPLKGIWFRITDVSKTGITAEAVSFTGRVKKK